MSFNSKANKVFPGINWTGGSDIHVSLAVEWNLPFTFAEKEKAFEFLYQNNHSGQLFAFLQKKFAAFDWLISAEEFDALFNVDIYRQLYGKPPSKTKQMIANPQTGNIFHVISQVGEFTGGIRFWTRGQNANFFGDSEQDEEDKVVVGFRFRIVSAEEDEEERRERIRERCEEAMEEMVVIYNQMEVKEIHKVAEPQKVKELAVVYN